MLREKLEDKDEVAAMLTVAACSMLEPKVTDKRKAIDTALSIFTSIYETLDSNDAPLPKLPARRKAKK
jgi:hypothetical protein